MPENKKSTFPKESSGWHMVTSIPTVSKQTTVGETLDLLFEKAKEFESINYVYVVDGQHKLLGAVSIKELFRLKKDILVRDVMTTNLSYVHPYSDQERPVIKAIENDIKSVPVIDKEHKFLGVVSQDTIMEILHEEHIEDALRSVGVTGRAGKILNASATKQFFQRIPWLLVGLAGSIVAAFAIGRFEATLEEMVLLAAFIPAVVYMADAVGGQTQIIFVRFLAFKQKLNIKSYIGTETKIGLALSLSLGFLAMLTTGAIWQDPLFSIIVGLSFFATIIISTTVGVLIPLALYKIKYDPAVASGPFATVLRDVLSVIVYLLIAQAMLAVFS